MQVLLNPAQNTEAPCAIVQQTTEPPHPANVPSMHMYVHACTADLADDNLPITPNGGHI
jgi:hypothetical protein